jgi:uncharacterized protein (DUF362 family)
VVSVLKARDYSVDLAGRLLEGARQCGWDARGKRVLLKPNLVEYDRATCVNTNVAVVAAAVELFERLGAAQVRIGEGPGHRRDTLGLAEEAGYYRAIRRFEDRFVDLNRDDVVEAAGFLDGGKIYLPRTALDADLIVTMPKMKTHHWAGVTLAMKNLFGLVPGAVYGWPKNPLHYAGIDTAIVELNRMFPRTLAIVDAVVGMEGNGPIQGNPRHCGVLVMGADVVAVDATCCRIMGIAAERVGYLERSAGLGNLAAAMIEQRGELPAAVRTRFGLMPAFDHLREV